MWLPKGDIQEDTARFQDSKLTGKLVGRLSLMRKAHLKTSSTSLLQLFTTSSGGFCGIADQHKLLKQGLRHTQISPFTVIIASIVALSIATSKEPDGRSRSRMSPSIPEGVDFRLKIEVIRNDSAHMSFQDVLHCVVPSCVQYRPKKSPH